MGKGAVIATTLEPFDLASPRAAEIMSIVLTNAGVAIEPPLKTQSRVRALRTVALKLDGELDDWTNDVEDRNVSPYRHAEPVVLGADTLVKGEVAGDHELSGIVYFLWDDAGLYVGGLAVGGDRVVVQVGKRSLALTRDAAGWQATLSGKAVPCRSAELPDVRQFVDGRYLTFAEIDSRIGNVRPVRRAVRGRTFELRLPWRALGLSPATDTSFAIEIHRGDDAVLRVPSDASGGNGKLAFAR